MKLRTRRIVVAIISLVILAITILSATPPESTPQPVEQTISSEPLALAVLDQLEVKGRAPKTGYERSQFGNGWQTLNGCDTRNIILYRDLTQTKLDDECHVTEGILDDPYTGKTIKFTRGPDSGDVQIDHVVALSDAWQKGAQNLTYDQRVQLANDPLELLAVDGAANQQKGDGDAATWLPSNKPFRCQYVARQIAIKQKYSLWVTSAEFEAIRRILSACPSQQLPAK